MLLRVKGRWIAAVLIVILFIVAGAVCIGVNVFGTDANQPEPDQSQTGEDGQADASSHPAQSGGVQDGGSAASQPEADQSTDQDSIETEHSQLEQSYDFTQPVPQTQAVENSYFEDAAFVGDSRTDGFLIYSGIGCGKNLTSNGLSIFKLAEKKALTIQGKKYTLLEALALEQYKKVYFSLGINELGYFDDQGFYKSYREALKTIRQLQPDAVIYVQGLIPLNEEVIAQTGGRTYLTNEHLRVYNDLIRQAAQEEQVAYLDLYTEFADENGSLPAEASKDGVHLKSDWCKQWLSYLQTHTVDYDTLYPQQEEGVQQ